MKIGFIYGQPTSRATSGGSVHGYQLSRHLVRRGHELASFFYGDPTDPLIHHFRFRQILGYFKDLSCLYLRVEWSGGPEKLSPLKLLSSRRIPVIWELNGTPAELAHTGKSLAEISQVNRRLKRLAGLVDGVCAVSEEIAEYAQSTLGIKNVRTVPNGSDPILFQPRSPAGISSRREPLRVAWLGTTKAAWQDFDTMFNAATELARQKANIQFHIFGDPRSLPAVVPENVFLRGVVAYDLLGEELRKLDVGLHLFRAKGKYRVEGSPLKIFDYMACGLAVVTQGDGQRRELINRWQAGLATTGEVEDLLRRLLALESDRSLCRKFGRNGRIAVEKFFNWQRAAIQTEEFLSSMNSVQ